MEKLPGELSLKIFQRLDHQTLTAAAQVCRKWRTLASDGALWFSLFKQRWGPYCAKFYAPDGSKTWKDVYIVQDRCDHYGLGKKIIREGRDYYLIHQGQIQRCLSPGEHGNGSEQKPNPTAVEHHQPSGIFDSILFFLGDLETACAAAKRARISELQCGTKLLMNMEEMMSSSFNDVAVDVGKMFA